MFFKFLYIPVVPPEPLIYVLEQPNAHDEMAGPPQDHSYCEDQYHQ